MSSRVVHGLRLRHVHRPAACQFRDRRPGAFNLFSGLAVAMSDSNPVLAISGYSSLDWAGRGSLNETSGLNNTPDSRAMFAATTKGSFLVTDVADTCDVLEKTGQAGV